MAKLGDISEYEFRLPLLIYGEKLELMERDSWKSGESWIGALANKTGLKGIVLPLELELKVEGLSRQRLLGVELLNWLRWSGAEPVRFASVLSVAWQSLGQILRRNPNLLLIAEGTRFLRLPDAAENGRKALVEFVEAVRTGKAEPCRAE